MFFDREIIKNGIAEKLDVDKGEMRGETLEILRDLCIDTKSRDATKPVIPEGANFYWWPFWRTRMYKAFTQRTLWRRPARQLRFFRAILN